MSFYVNHFLYEKMSASNLNGTSRVKSFFFFSRKKGLVFPLNQLSLQSDSNEISGLLS